MKLREAARGCECQVRLVGICNHDPETTVLAHFRLSGLSGTALKPVDVCGAHACSACHDAIDRRSHRELEYDFVRLAHAEGVVRTLNLLVKQGLLKW